MKDLPTANTLFFAAIAARVVVKREVELSYVHCTNNSYTPQHAFADFKEGLSDTILVGLPEALPDIIGSSFGDLYEIKSAPFEIFVNGATANDVVVIAALTPVQLQIR